MSLKNLIETLRTFRKGPLTRFAGYLEKAHDLRHRPMRLDQSQAGVLNGQGYSLAQCHHGGRRAAKAANTAALVRHWPEVAALLVATDNLHLMQAVAKQLPRFGVEFDLAMKPVWDLENEDLWQTYCIGGRKALLEATYAA